MSFGITPNYNNISKASQYFRVFVHPVLLFTVISTLQIRKISTYVGRSKVQIYLTGETLVCSCPDASLCMSKSKSTNGFANTRRLILVVADPRILIPGLSFTFFCSSRTSHLCSVVPPLRRERATDQRSYRRFPG